MVHGNAHYESSKHSRPSQLPKVCTSITTVKHMQLCLSMQAHAKHWQSDSSARVSTASHTTQQGRSPPPSKLAKTVPMTPAAKGRSNRQCRSGSCCLLQHERAVSSQCSACTVWVETCAGTPAVVQNVDDMSTVDPSAAHTVWAVTYGPLEPCCSDCRAIGTPLQLLDGRRCSRSSAPLCSTPHRPPPQPFEAGVGRRHNHMCRACRRRVAALPLLRPRP